jgi:hypothetical protein
VLLSFGLFQLIIPTYGIKKEFRLQISCRGLIYQAHLLFGVIKNVCLINQTPTQYKQIVGGLIHVTFIFLRMILCRGLIYQAHLLFGVIKNVCLINQTPTQYKQIVGGLIHVTFIFLRMILCRGLIHQAHLFLNLRDDTYYVRV